MEKGEGIMERVSLMSGVVEVAPGDTEDHEPVHRSTPANAMPPVGCRSAQGAIPKI